MSFKDIREQAQQLEDESKVELLKRDLEQFKMADNQKASREIYAARERGSLLSNNLPPLLEPIPQPKFALSIQSDNIKIHADEVPASFLDQLVFQIFRQVIYNGELKAGEDLVITITGLEADIKPEINN